VRAKARVQGLPVHGALMPLPLALFLVKFLTRQGDLVVDGFGGWGTSAMAAEQTGGGPGPANVGLRGLSLFARVVPVNQLPKNWATRHQRATAQICTVDMTNCPQLLWTILAPQSTAQHCWH
jgi:hypothetical protein